MDNYKGFIDFREGRSNQEIRYGLFYVGHVHREERVGLVYVIVFSIMAGVGFVAWLGWTWPSLMLTTLAAVLVIAIVVFLSVRQHRREPSRVAEWR
jgi:hypothetical protein